jgi:hypothetical protein
VFALGRDGAMTNNAVGTNFAAQDREGMMITRFALYILVATLGLTVWGCAAHQPGAGPVIGGGAEWLELEVVNSTTSTLRVLALDRGDETPLGRVDPLSSRTLRVPGTLTGLIRLVARPGVSIMPDRRHVSEPIVLQQGQRVTWELRGSPGTTDVPRVSTFRVVTCAPGQGC